MMLKTPLSHKVLRIFVSHSSKNNDFGTKLTKDLRRTLGNDDAVWYDTAGGLYGGESWWSKIVEKLTVHDVFLIVLSPDAMKSKWVLRELDMAMVEGKQIIPLLYRSCTIRIDLKPIQHISFLPPNSYGVAFKEYSISKGSRRPARPPGSFAD